METLHPFCCTIILFLEPVSDHILYYLEFNLFFLFPVEMKIAYLAILMAIRLLLSMMMGARSFVHSKMPFVISG